MVAEPHSPPSRGTAAMPFPEPEQAPTLPHDATGLSTHGCRYQTRYGPLSRSGSAPSAQPQRRIPRGCKSKQNEVK